MAYLLGWKEILRPIRDGYRHLFPSPDTGPTPEEREKQRRLDRLKGFAYFDTFDQLEAWTQSESDPIQKANTPLLPRSSATSRDGEKKANVLLCHDYSGNYHDHEASNSIGVDTRLYSCEYLQYVESFIYFSHKLVCIPPPSWTNTLHRNGVKAFGTLLIEPQTKDSDRLLRFETQNQDGQANIGFPLAKKLSDIVRHYRFDGWLVNIEKPFSLKNWESRVLDQFLHHLKEAMGNHGQLIWYDALTSDNKVVYQNALTAKNFPFATTCGALLTNYCWKEDQTLSSKAIALKYHMPLEKIYFGVDVWAQNKTALAHPRVTYPEKGGGGTNTGVAVHRLAETGLSVGIFAPAWSFEHFPSFFEHAERAVWCGHALPDGATCSCGDTSERHRANQEHPTVRSAVEYPAGSEKFFYTDFSRAFSHHAENEGSRMYDNKTLHSQLGSQSILPHVSTANSKDKDGCVLDVLNHQLMTDLNKTTLQIVASTSKVPIMEPDRMYDRYLSLFRLDMPADGSLQLTISCAYLLDMVDAITSFYLKFTNGIKLIPLHPTRRNQIQVTDYIIDCSHGSNEDVRLQELGVHLRSGAFTEHSTTILELREMRIVPHYSLEVTRDCSIRDIHIDKLGQDDTEHWRLRWTYTDHACENGHIPVVAGIPYSDITGPFSYFVVNVDGVNVGKAYALEHVLPKSLVEGFGPQDVRVALVGVGFDGRELARCEQTVKIG